mmetsp:Transcript_124150/g.386613  ORF Transcript_124150/g.386613 Transcript_124150/m.386613 type:complete len:212 (-) Transcript_124150:186-821(-)
MIKHGIEDRLAFEMKIVNNGISTEACAIAVGHIHQGPVMEDWVGNRINTQHSLQGVVLEWLPAGAGTKPRSGTLPAILQGSVPCWVLALLIITPAPTLEVYEEPLLFSFTHVVARWTAIQATRIWVSKLVQHGQPRCTCRHRSTATTAPRAIASQIMLQALAGIFGRIPINPPIAIVLVARARLAGLPAHCSVVRTTVPVFFTPIIAPTVV